jgi:hypothetical protein
MVRMKMTVRFIKTAGTLAFALSAFGLNAADTETNNANLTAKTLSGWQDSPDGKLSACLTVDKTNFSAGDKIAIHCAVRNNTDKPITILRPFGDRFDLYSGVTILGPHGPVPYSGPPPDDYVLGAGSFMELPPHRVVDETLELPAGYFPSLGASGRYTIRYEFLSNGYPKQPAPENYWQGRIKTSPVTILIR